MTPQENIRQRKAEMDSAIDGVLLNLNEPDDAFLRRHLECITASTLYADALSEATRSVNSEIAEAYQEEGCRAVTGVAALLQFVTGYRQRHRSDF